MIQTNMTMMLKITKPRESLRSLFGKNIKQCVISEAIQRST